MTRTRNPELAQPLVTPESHWSKQHKTNAGTVMHMLPHTTMWNRMSPDYDTEQRRMLTCVDKTRLPQNLILKLKFIDAIWCY